jgi:hypothetical protein
MTLKQDFNRFWVVFRRLGSVSPLDISRHRLENITKTVLEKGEMYKGFSI